MRVPRYWVKQTAETHGDRGQPAQVGCWGWSESSVDEARQRAEQSAKRLANRFVTGDLPDRYGYGERLPREEIIDEFDDADGKTRAFVTRNSYGTLVLNSRDLMFIDVDLPPKSPGCLLFPLGLFGRGSNGSADPQQDLQERIVATAKDHPDLGFRIYRTANGFRVLIHNRPIEAKSEQARRLLDEFGADPMYVRMCNNQDCFRARLTPKAWRCGVGNPPHRYPFERPEDEAENRRWEQAYQDRITSYGTCHFVESVGKSERHPAIADLIDLHDRLTKADSDDPLA